MYLKTLELQGFKSFADKTVIDLQKGISAIVGPNGSGKSNIVEAIKWVLGEQKAKSLRGHKMEDVIFSGTKKRKPLGMAEVSLLLDNSDYGMESDFSEIKVTRRLYRSGDGEYLLNGKYCRLKDIHQFFADTGIGNDGYSVIGQGRISQIVEAKPEERRAMVEETAGVVKYRERKKEALRKINSADDNLLRLNDIMTEIESRLGPLEQDSLNAQKYLTYKKEKDALSIGILAETALESREKLEHLEVEATESQRKHETINGILIKQETELETLKTALVEKEDFFGLEQQRYHDLNNEVQTLEGEMKSLQGRVFGYDDKLHLMKQEIAALESKSLSSAQQLDTEEKKYQECMEKTTAIQKELEELQAKRMTDEADLVKAEEYVEALRYEVFEAARIKGQKKNDKLSLEQSLTTAKKRQEAMAEKAHQYEEDENVLNHRIDEITDFIDEVTTKEEELNRQKSQYIADLAKEKERIEKKRDKSLGLKMESSRNDARLKALEELIFKREGFYPGVKSILDEKSKGRFGGILGVVAEVIKVEKPYALSIEAVLGGALQNLVAETGEDAAAGVSYLKQQRKGVATFLPLDLLKVRERQNVAREIQNHPSYIGVAADFVQIPMRMKSVVEYLLGNTILFKNLDDAITVMRKTKSNFRFVSLEGDIVNNGGSVSGGSREAKKNSFLQRQSEMDDLRHRLNTIAKEESSLALEITDISEKRQHIKEQLNVLDRQKEELLHEKSNFNSEIKRIDTQREFYFRETEVLGIEGEELNKFFLEANKQMVFIENEIAEAEKAEATLLEKINQEEQRFKNAKTTQTEGQSAYTELQIAYTEQKGFLENARVNCHRLEKERTEILDNLKKKQKDATLSSEEKANMTEKIELLNKEILEKNHYLMTFGEGLSKDKIEKEELNTEKDALELELKEHRREENRLKEEVYKLSLKKERLMVEAEQSETQLFEEHQMVLADALPYRREDLTKKDKRERIKTLKQQIAVLGNVNVGAIEEFQNVSERYTFLTEQKQDVEEAKTTLEEVVSRMDAIIMERFTHTFQRINESFQKTFPAFFQGGYGELRLTDPESPLDTGVEVVVQPPGKRLQHHSLLSGGELALSGIALLFAILQVKSSPFYVLDEIDAALDDVNVHKFGSYLQEYGIKSQFLVITHRQGTMESAKDLYGITMAEEGVSRTVSVRLEEEKTKEYLEERGLEHGIV